jgi:hypothetical protein
MLDSGLSGKERGRDGCKVTEGKAKTGRSGRAARLGPNGAGRAWRSGAGPRQRYLEMDSAYLSVLDRLVSNAVATPAPDALKVKLVDWLNRDVPTPCQGVPLRALTKRCCGAEDWPQQVQSALKLLGAVSHAANRPEPCLWPSSLLAKARKAHDQVECGGGETLARDADPAVLAAALAKRAPRFAGAPDFQFQRLKPKRAGLLKLGQVPGVFVEYQACRDGCRPLTLMAFDTRKDPESEAERMVFNGREFRILRHSGHTSLAWRGERDDWLYLLVTHCSFKNALAMAELVRK